MKKYILILFCFSFSGVFSQECDIYLNRMAENVEKNEIEKAKTEMKYFIACKEENKADSKVLGNLEKISYITKFDGDVAIAQLKNLKYAIVSKDLSLLKELKYDAASSFSKGFAVVDKNKKYGLIDSNGKTILEPKYNFIFEELYGYLVSDNEKWGLFSSGKFSIIPKYSQKKPEYIENLGLIVRDNQGKYGIVDINDNVKIPFVYDFIGTQYNVNYSIGGWNNKYISCVKDNKYGIIDYNNNLVYDFKFDEIKILDHLILFSENNEACYLFNTITNYKSKPLYGDIQYITDVTNEGKGYQRMPLKGFYEVKRAKRTDNGGWWVIINEEGKEVSDTFYRIYNSSENFVMIDSYEKMGFFNLINFKLITPVYDRVRDFSEGFAAVEKNGKWGFIDKNNNLIIEYRYDEPYGGSYQYKFINGLVQVIDKKGNGYFFINTKGECVIDCQNAPADHPRKK